ncbi:MAG: 50S ribosomal protein L18 [Candidatus Micrarchaeota archaeon]|nr:50S ribosomal protein L18 [Candidatus Micrarchaeota archaeon]
MAKATRSTYRVSFRRRREGRTTYSKRIAMLKSGEARLVARKTSSGIIAQVVLYSPQGDRVVASARSAELEKHGLPRLKSLPAAYLVGYALAKRALPKGVKRAILDMGRRTPVASSFAFAVVKGAVDGGLEIPHNPAVFNDDRFSGKHIADYAKLLKESDEAAYRKKFSAYLAKGVSPESLPQLIQSIKGKL